MRASQVAALLTLAAIWGGSFIFMRVLAPVLGPIATADTRVLIAGFALWAYMAAMRTPLDLAGRWKQYLAIGAINSAVPFVLFAFAALHIPAAYSAIVNSTSPLFGALFSAIWLAERLTMRKVAGLLLGVVGVALVGESGGAAGEGALVGLSVAACAGAAICYALGGIYMKKFVKGMTPMSISAGSQIMAGLLLLPLALIFPPTGAITPIIVGNALMLALVCSGAAYLLYYRLMTDLGPTKALTVTFLIPPFGIVWGMIFLNERPTWAMAAGCALVVLGTLLVVREAPIPAKSLKKNAVPPFPAR